MKIRSCLFLIFITTIFCGRAFAQISGSDYFNLAYSSLEQHKNDSAMFYFTKAIQLDTTMSNAYFNRGTLRLQALDYLGAIDDLTKCINIDLGFGRAYNNRGFAYLQLGLKYEACKDLRMGRDLSVQESITSFGLLCTDFKE